MLPGSVSSLVGDLERLAVLLPPPTGVLAVDWDAHARNLGCELPSDFKAFHERWGAGGVQDSAFTVDAPGLSADDWLQDEVRAWMPNGDMPSRPVFPELGGLLGFRYTESTKWWLLWETDTWEVTIHTLDGFRETRLAFVPWLVRALAGDLDARLIPDELKPYEGGEVDPPPGITAGPRGHWWCPHDSRGPRPG
jgi:hypothetical protein